MVPIAEPEILWDGDYCAERAAKAQKRILSTLMQYLNARDVYIPGVLIKTSFVASGKKSGDTKTAKDVGLLTFHGALWDPRCGVS